MKLLVFLDILDQDIQGENMGWSLRIHNVQTIQLSQHTHWHGHDNYWEKGLSGVSILH